MPAIIAAIVSIATNIGPAISGIVSAISAIISLISLFHKSSNTVAGKLVAMRGLAAAAKTANQTGDVSDLHDQLNMVAQAPQTVGL